MIKSAAIWRRPSSRSSSWRSSSCALLARSSSLPGAGLLGRAAGAAVGEQLRRPLVGDLLDRVALAQRRVGLAVGDVRAEPAVLDHHRLAGRRVGAELPQRRRGGGPPAALLRLGEQRRRLVEGDREQLVLGLERAGVRALLDVRAVAAVLRGDVLAVELAERCAAGSAAAPRRSSVTVSSDIDLNSDAVFSPSVTYGPYRPAFAVISAPGRRSSPARDRRTAPRSSSSTFSGVSSSGARSSGSEARCASSPPVTAALQVGAVAADPHHSVPSPSGIELTPRASISSSRFGDQPLQAALRGDALGLVVGDRVGPEVEALQPVDPRRSPPAIVVEFVLHAGGEAVVDQPGEVVLQQADHREGHQRRDERRALLPDVAAVLDRLHDRRVRRRAADAQLLHRLDQRRLGVARRRRGACGPSASKSRGVERVAAGQLRQPLLGVVASRLGRRRCPPRRRAGSRGR